MTITAIASSATEGDVETHVVIPLFTRTEYLGIEQSHIKSKEFLTAFDIGKGAKTKRGYVPDFCVYVLALPTVVIEVKAPNVPVAEGWEEASLYAHTINKRYPSKKNPCEFIFATNGREFRAGRWDSSNAIVEGDIGDLIVGSGLLGRLQDLISFSQIQRFANIASAGLKLLDFKRPANQDNGAALIASKLEPNTFAADLAPILRRYFSSRDQNRDPEIYRNAYVSSNEITSYDKILELFLTDRLSRSKARTEVKTTKKRAEAVTKKLSQLTAARPQSGELQLITGGVGTGKSLFARRYKEFLQPSHLRNSSHWAFLDFNFAPEDLRVANDWVCASFVQSVLEEGAPINLRDPDDQERVFASDLADRSAYYHRMEAIGAGRGELEKARDLEGWRQDPVRLAAGISRHLQGDRNEILIVVFDNVDRRDVDNQLSAFQLALWFMNQMRCLVVLQMRDVTFEAHKHDRPLDTYKTGQIFHISPPRFVDVVKRRLELSLIELGALAPETISYKTPTGLTISYPKSRAGEFLKGIYLELFLRPTNVSRILEALAGRNVRKALDMFLAIITSGHMPEDLITSVASGFQVRSFPENLVLRILMRQDYRFYNDNSGFVANIFYCDRNWMRPSNFLVVEILYYLISQRKAAGDNGQMGFVCFERLRNQLEKFGFVESDIYSASQYLMEKELIEADSCTSTVLISSDCIKASASGWAHMRILSSRSEYIGAVLPTTAINDRGLQARIFDLMQTENRYGSLFPNQIHGAVEHFFKYLQAQQDKVKIHPGYAAIGKNGSSYILGKIAEALRFDRAGTSATAQADWLDA